VIKDDRRTEKGMPRKGLRETKVTKKAAHKTYKRAMPRKGQKETKVTMKAARIDESALTKGELRKLNALRKTVGDELGEKTFAKWLRRKSEKVSGEPEDTNALLIAEALIKLIETENLHIPRGGYLVSRGRGGVIVERAKKP